MADNLNVTEGSGKVVATDDIGGAHYQKIEEMKKRADDTIVESWYDGGTISNIDVDTIENLAEIDCTGFSTLYVSFTTTVAFTSFDVAFRVHASGTYFTIASTTADFSTPEGPILGVSGDLTLANSTDTHWLKLDVTGIQGVRLRAASSSANVSGHYGLN